MAAPLDKCCSRTPYAQPPEQPSRTIVLSVQDQPSHALHSSRPTASARMRAALRVATLAVLRVATMAEATAEGATAGATVATAAGSTAAEARGVSMVVVSMDVVDFEAVAATRHTRNNRT